MKKMTSTKRTALILIEEYGSPGAPLRDMEGVPVFGVLTIVIPFCPVISHHVPRVAVAVAAAEGLEIAFEFVAGGVCGSAIIGWGGYAAFGYGGGAFGVYHGGDVACVVDSYEGCGCCGQDAGGDEGKGILHGRWL